MGGSERSIYFAMVEFAPSPEFIFFSVVTSPKGWGWLQVYLVHGRVSAQIKASVPSGMVVDVA